MGRFKSPLPPFCRGCIRRRSVNFTYNGPMSEAPQSDALVAALQAIHTLLVKHNHPGQARVIEELLSMYRTNIQQFCTSVTSVDVWGGSGAVWDVDIQGADRFAFRSSVIALAHAMDEVALGTDRSRWIASIFQQWNAKEL